MNNWMSDPFEYPDKPIDRGKVLSSGGSRTGWADLPATRMWTATACHIGRSRERTIQPRPTSRRGTGHTEKATYSEREDDCIDNMDRLHRKFETMRAARAPPAIVQTLRRRDRPHLLPERRVTPSKKAAISSHGVRISVSLAAPARLIRLHRNCDDSSRGHERVYVVDQNRDGQLLALMRMDLRPETFGEAAQRALLSAACRSTRAPSPTKSSRQEGTYEHRSTHGYEKATGLVWRY